MMPFTSQTASVVRCPQVDLASTSEAQQPHQSTADAPQAGPGTPVLSSMIQRRQVQHKATNADSRLPPLPPKKKTTCQCTVKVVALTKALSQCTVHIGDRANSVPTEPASTEEVPPALPPKIKRADVKGSLKIALPVNSFFVEQLSKLHHALQRVAEDVQCSGNKFLADLENRNRFRDIPTLAATNIGYDLNGNRVAVHGKNIAIATQYPMAHQIENHLRMLADTRATVLVVLVSQSEIADSSKIMDDYFSQSGTFGSIMTTSIEKGEPIRLGKQRIHYKAESFDLMAQQYHLTISESGKRQITVPVIHVLNWPDKQSISTESALTLSEMIENLSDKTRDLYKVQEDVVFTDPSKCLPVYHCRAGVGRTGLMIGLRALRTTDASAYEIGKGIRETRNPLMLQTQDQIDTFAEAAAKLGKTLI